MAVRILLDTNRYTDLARGVTEVVERAEAASELWLPLFVLGELRAGFVGGSRSERNAEALDRFLQRSNTGVLLPDVETATYYARIYNDLRRAGRPIPTNDIWIAALALQHDLTLDARDQHFNRVPGLRLVDAAAP
jgi:tRNA(fMet)-specific endonuclease VapC